MPACCPSDSRGGISYCPAQHEGIDPRHDVKHVSLRTILGEDVGLSVTQDDVVGDEAQATDVSTVTTCRVTLGFPHPPGTEREAGPQGDAPGVRQR